MTTVYKTLRLVTPERASALGIPAEAPVFVSPYVHLAVRCPNCVGTWAPLVYGFGRRTTSVHLCAGIFHLHRLLSQYSYGDEWMAEAESDCHPSEPCDQQAGGTWLEPMRLLPTDPRFIVRPRPAGESIPLVECDGLLWRGDLNYSPYRRHSVTAPAYWSAWRMIVRDGVPLFVRDEVVAA